MPTGGEAGSNTAAEDTTAVTEASESDAPDTRTVADSPDYDEAAYNETIARITDEGSLYSVQYVDYTAVCVILHIQTGTAAWRFALVAVFRLSGRVSRDALALLSAHTDGAGRKLTTSL